MQHDRKTAMGCKHKQSSQSFPRQRALPLAPAVVSNGAMLSRHVQHRAYSGVMWSASMHTMLRMQRDRKTAMGASTNNLAKVSRGSVHCL